MNETMNNITTDPRTGHFGTTVNTRGNKRFADLLKEAKVGLVPTEVK